MEPEIVSDYERASEAVSGLVAAWSQLDPDSRSFQADELTALSFDAAAAAEEAEQAGRLDWVLRLLIAHRSIEDSLDRLALAVGARVRVAKFESLAGLYTAFTVRGRSGISLGSGPAATRDPVARAA